VKTKVEQILLNCDLTRMNQEIMADTFGISQTSLRRLLGSEGDTYKDILERVRQRRLAAIHRRNYPAWPHADDVAQDLGFTEVGSFYRWYAKNHDHMWRDARERHFDSTLVPSVTHIADTNYYPLPGVA
jgi:AraC-like DNA-binding protein